MFINTFIDQDFVDRYKLFVVGKRLNDSKSVWEYYVKSRNAGEYKEMLLESLYHPPYIEIEETKTRDGIFYLNHHFEGKPLVNEYIANTMLGIAYLWGDVVKLETTELAEEAEESTSDTMYTAFTVNPPEKKEPEYRRVLYTMDDKELSRVAL